MSPIPLNVCCAVHAQCDVCGRPSTVLLVAACSLALRDFDAWGVRITSSPISKVHSDLVTIHYAPGCVVKSKLRTDASAAM